MKQFFILSICVLASSFLFTRCSNPEADGEDAANQFCECSHEKEQNAIKALGDFRDSFDSYNFKTRKDARLKLNEITNKVSHADCDNETELNFNKKREKYASDVNALQIFIDKYKSLKGICNYTMAYQTNENGVQPIYSSIEKKISSIALINPSIDKMKSDLLHKTIYSNDFWGLPSGWQFEQLEAIKTFDIVSATRNGDNLEMNVKMNLVDTNKTHDLWVAQVIITYSPSDDDWKFLNLKTLMYKKSK